ncbi:MAG: hydroxyacylglutathione hydrolase [Chitinophagaceae bacterium]|nr:hydroxyacylglutathione hydrolase [Chitinophagaceae bacterium]
MIRVQSFTVNPFQENTYVLSNEKRETLIIDPGFYFSAEYETLNKYLNENELTPVKLLNTHCHLDHVFGNKLVAGQFGLEPFLHKDEEQVLEMASKSALMYGLGFDNYTGPLHFLEEGDTIKLGDEELQILLAPGHSPGSICFYSSTNGFVIAGDVLFFESVGRSDLPGGNAEQLLKSIHEKLFTLPDETIVYPGHGPSTTIGHEKQHNPFCSFN